MLLEHTLYKAWDLLKNGDNIIHLMVSQKFGDSFILQKLLERLEFETGSKETVKNDYLLVKSKSDELNAFEYWAGNKVHAPILFKYKSSEDEANDDFYSESKVLDVEIIHHMTIEEENKQDKKIVANDVRNKARKKYMNLIKTTENLNNTDQFVTGYATQLGLDLSSKLMK